MSVNAVDQTTGNTTPLAGNTNNLVGNLSALTTNTKSDAVGAINEVNQTKQNAEVGKGLSTNDFTDAYKDKVDNNAGAIEAIVNEYGAKNLLPNRATSQTLNGVTFTVNTDGSVTVNGTATARTTFAIKNASSNFTLPSGSYILTKGLVQSGFGITIEAYNDNSWVKVLAISAGSDTANFEVDYEGYDRLVILVYVDNGVTVDNKTLSPMVRDARISDDTYVPYAMTNRELTGAVDQLKSGLNGLLKYKTFTGAATDTSNHLYDTGVSAEQYACLGGVTPYNPNFSIQLSNIETTTNGHIRYRLYDVGINQVVSDNAAYTVYLVFVDKSMLSELVIS